MGHTSRRRYHHGWACPICGGELLLNMAGEGKPPYRVCVSCVDDDGHPVEAQEVLVSLSEPPTRNQRLFGFNSPLRKTRSR
jgi:hypothetical protein